ncbi:MAG: formate--tetrahydrofolate ligase [Polyangiaceae bacterium]
MSTPFTPRPIAHVAEELGLPPDSLEPYGKDKAKVDLAALSTPPKGKGRLVLVTAINPTPAGEGKTTTSIALAMGMRRLGKNAVLALREPSLGPVFGVKGGGTGGGKASLTPSNDINLHFTGDIHAITTAHNLLSAIIDNALHFGEEFGDKGALDPREVTWGRALDMNDRSLRRVMVGLGGRTGGVPREERFDITAASEIMAILALSASYEDLEARLARVHVGLSTKKVAITAGDLGASSAMCAVLKDALKPNLVQSEEGGPAFVHCGPFANIAHGCNSVLATKLALHYGDFAVTEAGFGFDLGGEKFLDIKCRQAGIWPRAVVIVATLRAIKMHGGAAVKLCGEPNAEALRLGLPHLEKHLENAKFFGIPPVVAINVFPNDTAEEIEIVAQTCAKYGAKVARSEGFARGGEGATELARIVSEVAEASDSNPPQAKYSYELSDEAEAKITKIAKNVYGARDVSFGPAAKKELDRIRALGFGDLPVCMAKTHLSLSDDPKVYGRPAEFLVQVREVRLSAGAGFLVALTGDIMTMPGLPKVPAARNVRMLPDGTIKGLMQND